MTEQQIQALSKMTSDGSYEFSIGCESGVICIKLVESGHWMLSYHTHDVHLYYNTDISSYDSFILRHMYNSYLLRQLAV
jgi:hypothetical protein